MAKGLQSRAHLAKISGFRIIRMPFRHLQCYDRNIDPEFPGFVIASRTG